MLRKILLYALVLAAVFGVVGCGGGGGDDGGSGGTTTTITPEKFRVISVSPADGAVNVGVNSIVSLEFNENIDVFSVSADNFLLVQGTKVSGALSASGKTVVFIPNKDLKTLSSCVITLSGVKSSSGAIMEPFTSSFTTGGSVAGNTVKLSPANWVTYSKGGAEQATFDKAAGTVTVKTASDPTDVSVRWAPVPVDKTKIYRVSFPCSSVPQQTVQVQLKENGGAYRIYGMDIVTCAGTVDINLVPYGATEAGDPAARLNINFGTAVGVYTIGEVTIKY